VTPVSFQLIRHVTRTHHRSLVRTWPGPVFPTTNLKASRFVTMAAASLDVYSSHHEGEEPELQGSISVPGTAGQPDGSGGLEFNTLDEPIRETIKRDLGAVGTKFYHVLYPVEKKSLLKDWDLWGPLILCTFMATVLQGHDTDDNDKQSDGGPQFAEVFVIVWVGAMIVTLNTKLLGGHISFFQSVCVLGYCLLPLSLSLFVCSLVLMATQTTGLLILRAIVVLIGFVWSTFASMQFLGDCQPPNRKALAVYPMLLFYFIISWMVISHSA